MVNFGEQLRNIRKNRGLTLEALASQTGIDFRRLSSFECSVRRPNARELSVLSTALETSFHLPPSSRLSSPERLYARPPRLEMHLPSCLSRLRAARKHYPELYRAVQGLIWPNRHFLHRYPTDSTPEVFLPLMLLKEDFTSAALSPLRLDFRQWAVVHGADGDYLQAGDVRHVALWRGEFVCLPQVTMQPKRGTWRVDCLVRYQSGRYRRWCYLELDGPHHHPDRDHEKSDALAMPVVRFRDTDFCRPDFVDWLLSQIIRACLTQNY